MNQQERIKDYLEAGNELTRRVALDQLGIWEAPARISSLKRTGYAVHTRFQSVTNRWGDKVSIAVWSKG